MHRPTGYAAGNFARHRRVCTDAALALPWVFVIIHIQPLSDRHSSRKHDLPTINGLDDMDLSEEKQATRNGMDH